MTKSAANSNSARAKGAKPAEAGTMKADPATSGLSAFELRRIKHRAHALWREEGSPQGRDREFWERAELQVLKGQGA